MAPYLWQWIKRCSRVRIIEPVIRKAGALEVCCRVVQLQVNPTYVSLLHRNRSNAERITTAKFFLK
jgi:hypothetical protein